MNGEAAPPTDAYSLSVLKYASQEVAQENLKSEAKGGTGRVNSINNFATQPFSSQYQVSSDYPYDQQQLRI